MEWDLSLLFKTQDEIETLLPKLEEQVKSLTTYKGKILDFSTKNLSEFIDEYELLQYSSAKLSQYPSLRVSANSKDEDAVKLMNRIQKITTDWSKSLAFIALEVGELLQKSPEYLNSPDLENRRYYLQRLASQSKHRLSEDEEIVIMEKDQYGVRQWSQLQGDLVSKTVFEIDVNGEKQSHSWSSGYGLRSHKDHETRKSAMIGLGKGLQEKADSYAFALRNVSANYITEAKRRGYSHYMQSSTHTSHLSVEIIDTMFDVLLKNVDVFQEFLKIKAKLLGTDKLRGEDLEAPFPFTSEREITWDEAKQIVVDGFTEFDPEFGEIADHMFTNNRVDAKPRDGKRAGAFCSTHYEDKSSFIMMSYNNNMDSLGTLAHEMGHAVHAHYITREQPLFHSNMGMPLAETASEFGSLLFNLKFMNEAKSEDERKAVLFNMVEQFMTAMYEVGSRTLFETGLYDALDNNEYLNHEKINEIFWDARSKTFGDAIDWLPEQAYHWCWKPHYYIPSFRYYNYPYVFGEFSVLSLYASYRKDSESFTQNYKAFLKSGGSRHPTEMFKELFDFDLTSASFWEAGIEELRNFVDQCKSYL